MFDELRRKPKSVRSQYAFWSAFVITALITALWLLSLMVKFNHEPMTEEVDKISPGGAFSQFYQEIKSNFTEKVKSLPLDEEGSTTAETMPEPSSEATSTVIQKPAGPTVLIATTSAEKAAN